MRIGANCMVKLTLEQLNEAMNWWRSYLGLSDWDIKIYLKPSIDMDALAESLTRFCHKELDIWISEPETRDKDRLTRCDMETDLVHEMLHAVMNPAEEELNLEDGVLNDTCFEQPIEMLAKSLVKLRRLTNHRFKWESSEQTE